MTAPALAVAQRAPIPTWFGIGGAADALVAPASLEELRAALEARDPASGPVRTLGDGANLLVDDDGVDGLVVCTSQLGDVRWSESGVTAGAGARLPLLVAEACRRGLSGLEGLGGIPASLGGAVRMNAGGAFGEIGPLVRRVVALDHDGRAVELSDAELRFGYRRSNLGDLIIAEAELRLGRAEPADLRAKLKQVMEHKKHAQPLGASSAGCVFQNPEVDGRRVSAGRLIDRAGLKGARAGGAVVSDQHANFIVAEEGAKAADVLALITLVQERVRDALGIELHRELVVWSREDGHG